MPLTPEQLAREEIDEQLEACGWVVQDFASMNIHAGLGVAVREYPLRWKEGAKTCTGSADYLLYADGRAIGVVEAKPAGYSLRGVEPQSKQYTDGLPEGIPNYRLPLPFAYESTGKITHFTNGLDPDHRSREVFTFHRPEELKRLVELECQLRSNLCEMPVLEPGRLWPVQRDAITNLERSLAANRPRALIQMATGSGKTYTACSFCYRLIKFGKAKRILFLVDRNNLARQTLNEFQQFVSPQTNDSFTNEYVVQHLRGNAIDPASKVVITTIQRLYAMLRGDEEFEAEREEGSMFESGSPATKDSVPVEYSPRVPIETFDFVVVDECHRSIYNVWRQVLDYFDAFTIGLTATPTPQTIGFFKNNVVQDYSHERAVADGVNVGYSVYRIDTKITQEGGRISARTYVPHRDRRTKERTLKELEEDLTYSSTQLDRDVVAEDQIRLVVRTFRDRLPTEIFPGRTEVPKTLVFAKTDNHAEDIVNVIREEFGKGNEFCQKITSKTTGMAPEDLLAQFRNSFNPRIAVTVDMIATGTDVKALECLLFMRNIRSLSYFEQMKGRGVRIINPNDLQSVTPDAKHKTHFVVVDAVGVCENDKSLSKPLDRQPTVGLDKILQQVAQGIVHADIVSTLASRLTRLDRQIGDEERSEIAEQADGSGPGTLAANLLASIDPDRTRELTVQKFDLSEREEPTEKQLATVEREEMTEALKPFHRPDLRDTILNVRRILEQVIDEVTQDELIRAEYDRAALDDARSKLADFTQFIEDNKDEIEALQILYSRPYRAGLRYRHVKQLAEELKKPPLSLHDPVNRLWSMYTAVEPQSVKGAGGNALVDLVAIIKHAITPEQPLEPVAETVETRYREWRTEKEATGFIFTPEQGLWLDAIKDHIANALSIEQDDFQEIPFSQMGGLGKAYQVFGDQLTVVLDELNERLAA